MQHLTKIEVLWDDRLVGKIGLSPRGTCLFQYDTDWLRNGVSISPLQLPLTDKVFEASYHPFDGGFGVFDDSMPDGWGMLILARYLKQQGIKLTDLNLLDILSLVGSTGRGALEYRPDRSEHQLSSTPDLDQLAASVADILAVKDITEAALQEIYLRGGSPGGARPKVFAHLDGEEWLIKFPAKYDSVQAGKEEYLTALLAQQCGIKMPPVRLLQDKYFTAQRFDRQNDKKIFTISVAGLLNADYRSPSIDYQHLFALTAHLTHDVQELWQLYRLLCFNYLIGNKDDHAKNFSFLYTDAWHLAPAYDLTVSSGIGGYHTTTINNAINPTDADILTLAHKAGLDQKKAQLILSTMREIISSRL